MLSERRSKIYLAVCLQYYCFSFSLPFSRYLSHISGSTDRADQAPKHMNVGQYVASNVPSLAEFSEKSQDSASTLKALASVMLSIQRYLIRLPLFF